MPRFHFNTYDGHTTLDEEGTVLSGLHAARRQALRLFGALIESDVSRLQLGEHWRMHVPDDRGGLLFRFDLSVLEFRQTDDLVELQGAAT